MTIGVWLSATVISGMTAGGTQSRVGGTPLVTRHPRAWTSLNAEDSPGLLSNGHAEDYLVRMYHGRALDVKNQHRAAPIANHRPVDSQSSSGVSNT